MKIIEVSDKHTSKKFILLPVKLYQDQPFYIRPLDQDIEAVFDQKKNKSFRQGECIRWILMDDNNCTIGRVAAFHNKKTANKNNDQPTGGIGFFECVNDQSAAFMLFDQSKRWLQDKGMEAMDGPINFGERDKWWGLLVDGFELEPNYGINYNLPYYRGLFEAYGFRDYFQQFTYGRKTRDKLGEVLQKKADRIFEDPDFSFRHVKISELSKYAEDFRIVYNKAWARHGVPKMSSAQAKSIMKQMKPIMDERIVWFGYYREEPICFYVNLLEVNQIFKHLNGNLNLWGKLKFLWYKKRGVIDKMVGVAFGVTPEHQGKGIEGALIIATASFVQTEACPYINLEFNWIGDFNPKMIKVLEQVGCKLAKTHITYRKLFDKNKPFKRARVIT